MQHSIDTRAASITTPEHRLAPPAGATRALAELARNRRTGMLIGLTQLQRVIARLHGLAPDASVTVLGRLKYMLKQSFPQRYETQPGGRTSMNLADALQVTFTFELLQLGIANGVALDAVRAAWDDTIRGALGAAAHARGDAAGKDDATTLVATGATLQGEGGGAPPLRFEASSATAAADEAVPRTRAVINAKALLAGFADALVEELVATQATVDRELRQFAAVKKDDPGA